MTLVDTYLAGLRKVLLAYDGYLEEMPELIGTGIDSTVGMSDVSGAHAPST